MFDYHPRLVECMRHAPFEAHCYGGAHDVAVDVVYESIVGMRCEAPRALAIAREGGDLGTPTRALSVRLAMVRPRHRLPTCTSPLLKSLSRSISGLSATMSEKDPPPCANSKHRTFQFVVRHRYRARTYRKGLVCAKDGARMHACYGVHNGRKAAQLDTEINCLHLNRETQE